LRVLHLTPELPYWPGGSGGATRQFHLLRRLAELGHEVTVVAPIPAGEAHRTLELAAAGVRVEGPVRPGSRVSETLGALARQPALVPMAATLPVLAWQGSVLWAAMVPHVRRELARRPDVVTVEHDNAAQWVTELPVGVPAVLTLQNVGRGYYESRARAAGGPRRLALGAEARRFARHDSRWLPRYCALVAVSDRDAEDLRADGARRVEVVPNGVAADELRPAPPSPEPATVLFTGTLSHPPNSDGIRWFAATAWRRVRAARPEAKLLVVGREPPRSVRELDGREGIEVVGPVADMAPWFARATAVVVPLRSGGGTRLKILEAFAGGRAVVSTRVGAEGLDVTDGRELVLADREEDIADGVLALLGDAGRRERLAAASRDLAERRYDWRVLGDQLDEVLRRVVAGRAGL